MFPKKNNFDPFSKEVNDALSEAIFMLQCEIIEKGKVHNKDAWEEEMNKKVSLLISLQNYLSE